MTNVTLSVDEEALKKARIRALEQGTSVNAVLRDLLEAYAGVQIEQTAATQDLLALSRQSTASRGGRRWTRDELHDGS
jgi:plasmid stability protein